jgi:hypothetical protein
VKREVLAVLALLAFTALAVLGYAMLFEGFGSAGLDVVELRGGVAMDDGAGQRALLRGATVRAGGEVIAGSDGYAVLAAGNGLRVTVAPDATVRVTAITAREVRLELERGRVEATVRAAGPRLEVEAGAARASALDADFVVVRDGAAVGLESTRGRVDVGGIVGVEALDAGERVVATAGVLVRAAAGEQLLLAVTPLPATRVRAGTASLAGRTAPGARVQVLRGEDIVVTGVAGPDGAFRLDAVLLEGDNHFVVEARDLLGAARVAEVQVTRDTTAPTIGVEVR